MKRNFWLIFITLIVAQGCSTERLALKAAWPLVEGQYAAIQEEKDPYLAGQALPASLKMMEGFLHRDADNPLLLNRAGRGILRLRLQLSGGKRPGPGAGLVHPRPPVRLARARGGDGHRVAGTTGHRSHKDRAGKGEKRPGGFTLLVGAVLGRLADAEPRSA